MTKLLARHIATVAEMRELDKVLERSGGEPAEAVAADPHRALSVSEATSIAKDRSAKVQPALEYLGDK